MATSFPVGIYPPFNPRSTKTFPTTARGECSQGKNDGVAGEISNMISNSSSSLNDVLNGLKYKYVELQEKNKKDLKKLEEETEKVKGENAKKELEIGKLKEEIDILRNEISLLKEHSVDEKKDLFNENINLKKKLENINSEVSRSDLSYKRVLKEKEELLNKINGLRMEFSSSNEKCEDLQNIIEHLKQKISELEKEKDDLKEKNFEQANIISNIDLDARQLLIDSIQKEKIKLMANVKRLEVAYAEEKQLREKIINDRDKIIEENVSLNTQIDELKRKLESVI
ncbi:hypothetical protein BCR32DRAFT_244396 [Anaeromyces robustus]|uniref:Uncharacterized protein n=1 Tax=Anaeromyces robustus TaxID=1754192 RepID=A0A1Y1X8T5_9FUNG|nr:hypothetical protein BCR32DRAFT_244396 [Anaeromyces robustus]|eukprot:ORX82142.1 hypothetical protein BCR32DRAFT_244396 [Anaeromyces robustus]